MGSLGVSNRIAALKFLTKLSEVESELKNAGTEVQNLRKQIAVLISARDEDKAQAAQRAEDDRVQIRAAQDEIMDLKAQVASRQEQVENLKERLTAEESKFRALLAHRADADKKLRADHLSLQIAFDAKNEEHAQILKKLQNQLSLTDALEGEVGATRDHLESIGAVIAKHEELVAGKEKRLRTLLLNQNAVVAKLAKQKDAIKALKLCLAEKDKLLAAQTSKLQEVETGLSVSQEALLHTKKEVALLQDQLARANSRQCELRNEVKDATELLCASRHEAAEHLKALSTITAQVKRIGAEADKREVPPQANILQPTEAKQPPRAPELQSETAGLAVPSRTVPTPPSAYAGSFLTAASAKSAPPQQLGLKALHADIPHSDSLPGQLLQLPAHATGARNEPAVKESGGSGASGHCLSPKKKLETNRSVQPSEGDESLKRSSMPPAIPASDQKSTCGAGRQEGHTASFSKDAQQDDWRSNGLSMKEVPQRISSTSEAADPSGSAPSTADDQKLGGGEGELGGSGSGTGLRAMASGVISLEGRNPEIGAKAGPESCGDPTAPPQGEQCPQRQCPGPQHPDPQCPDPRSPFQGNGVVVHVQALATGPMDADRPEPTGNSLSAPKEPAAPLQPASTATSPALRGSEGEGPPMTAAGSPSGGLSTTSPVHDGRHTIHDVHKMDQVIAPVPAVHHCPGGDHTPKAAGKEQNIPGLPASTSPLQVVQDSAAGQNDAGPRPSLPSADGLLHHGGTATVSVPTAQTTREGAMDTVAELELSPWAQPNMRGLDRSVTSTGGGCEMPAFSLGNADLTRSARQPPVPRLERREGSGPAPIPQGEGDDACAHHDGKVTGGPSATAGRSSNATGGPNMLDTEPCPEGNPARSDVFSKLGMEGPPMGNPARSDVFSKLSMEGPPKPSSEANVQSEAGNTGVGLGMSTLSTHGHACVSDHLTSYGIKEEQASSKSTAKGIALFGEPGGAKPVPLSGQRLLPHAQPAPSILFPWKFSSMTKDARGASKLAAVPARSASRREQPGTYDPFGIISEGFDNLPPVLKKGNKPEAATDAAANDTNGVAPGERQINDQPTNACEDGHVDGEGSAMTHAAQGPRSSPPRQGSLFACFDGISDDDDDDDIECGDEDKEVKELTGTDHSKGDRAGDGDLFDFLDKPALKLPIAASSEALMPGRLQYAGGCIKRGYDKLRSNEAGPSVAVPDLKRVRVDTSQY